MSKKLFYTAVAAVMVVLFSGGAEALTLQEHIDATPAGGTCHVPAGTYAPATIPAGKTGISLVCDSGTAVVTSGYSGDGLTVSAANVTVSGFTFRACARGVTGDEGYTLSIKNCWFESCTNAMYGGGVYRAGTVTACTFTNCTAYFGGGYSGEKSIGRVSRCTFADCRATSQGGGIEGVHTVDGCTFRNCTARTGGGASNCMVVEDGSFTGCVADGGSGGGVFACAFVTRSTFVNGRARDGGGAEMASLFACLLIGNEATDQGGGAETCSVSNCTFVANTCAANPEGSGCYSMFSGEKYKPADSIFCGCGYSVDGMTNLPASYGTYTVDESVFADAEHGDYHLNEYLAGGAERGAALKASDARDLDGNPIVRTLGAQDYFAAGCSTCLLPADTLQGKIDRTPAGGTCYVPAGTYEPATIPAEKTGITVACTSGVAVVTSGDVRCGIIVNAANVVLSGLVFRDCGRGVRGNSSQTLYVTNCWFENCTKSDYGSGISSAGTVVDCVFTNCTAENSGGGVYACSNVVSCAFTGCTAARYGGGAYDCRRIEDCVFDSCEAGIYGGGVDFGTRGSVSRCTFMYCRAEQGGGVNWATNLYACLFVKNRAERGGGARACFNVRNCTFVDNKATEVSEGSGLYAPGEIANDGMNPVDSIFSGCGYYIGGTTELPVSNVWKIDSSAFVNAERGDYRLVGYYGGDSARGAALEAEGALDRDGHPIVADIWGQKRFLAGCYAYYSDPDTLQGMIDRTPSGATCYVPAGTYEPAVVDRPGIHVVCTSGVAVVSSENDRWGIDIRAANVVLSGLVFRNCGYGVGGDPDRTLYVTNCWFENCTKAERGSGISSAGMVVDCVFTNCTATSGGGGAYACSNLVACTFVDCSANGGGGAFDCARIVDCRFIGCTGRENGGGVSYSSYPGGTVLRSTFRNCSASGGGGAYNASLFGCLFVGNSADYYGGGAMDCFNVRNCTFVDNRPGRNVHSDYGGIYTGSAGEEFLPVDSVFCGCGHVINGSSALPAACCVYNVGSSAFVDADHGDYHLKEYLPGDAARARSPTADESHDLEGSPMVTVKNGSRFPVAGCYAFPADRIGDLQSLIDATAASNICHVAAGVYCAATAGVDKTGIRIAGTPGRTILMTGHGCDGLRITGQDIEISGITFRECSLGVVGDPAKTLFITNCVFTGCSGDWGGGAVYQAGTVVDSVFTNCAATRGDGAGAYACSNLVACTFTDCRSVNGGGVAMCTRVADCTFTACSASRSGGCAFECDWITGCTFTNCTALFGGATSDCLVQEDCRFVSCSVTTFGGGCYYTEDSRRMESNRVQRCTFTGCRAKQGGGAYNANLVGCTLDADTATEYGGGAYGGSATGCSFTRNSANIDGGGIFQASTVAESHFTDCTAERFGGGVRGSVRVTGCAFTNCRSEDSGGGVYNATQVSGCRFADCSAGKYGGGVDDCVTAEDSVFVNCRAGTKGGGFSGNMTNGRALRCTFTGCVSSEYGGGVYCLALAEDCEFTGCVSTEYGGGMYMVTQATRCTMRGCSAAEGGGANYAGLEDCVLENNVASNDPLLGDGGGAWGGSATRCTFRNNVSRGNGGGAHGTSPLVDCVFEECVAGCDGGGAYRGGNILRCTFRKCRAGESGGGAYRYPHVENSVFESCTAGRGGGLVDCDLARNCTISACTATSYGGGMYKGLAENCVFRKNSGSHGGAAYSTRLFGSLLVGNHAEVNGGGAYQGSAYSCTFIGNMCTSNSASSGFYGQVSSDRSYDSLYYACSYQNSAINSFEADRNYSVSATAFVNLSGGDYHLDASRDLSGYAGLESSKSAYLANGAKDLDGVPIVSTGLSGTKYFYAGCYAAVPRDDRRTEVNTFKDTQTGASAAVTLRDAVEMMAANPSNFRDANGNYPVQFAAEAFDSSGSAVLRFSRAGVDVSGFSNGLLVVEAPAGKTLAIDGGKQWRAFRVRPGNRLRLANISFRDCFGSPYGRDPQPGAGGGAVLNGGYLEVSNCAFRACHGGNAYTHDGYDGTATGPGGAIYNQAGATSVVTHCTFAGNQGVSGGAFANRGTATLVMSTFHGNAAAGDAGGGGGSGGAVYGESGGSDTAIVNCTFTGNTAEATGGGVHSGGDLELLASIVTGNSVDGASDDVYAGGAVRRFVNTYYGARSGSGDWSDTYAHDPVGPASVFADVDTAGTARFTETAPLHGVTHERYPLRNDAAYTNTYAAVGATGWDVGYGKAPALILDAVRGSATRAKAGTKVAYDLAASSGAPFPGSCWETKTPTTPAAPPSDSPDPLVVRFATETALKQAVAAALATPSAARDGYVTVTFAPALSNATITLTSPIELSDGTKPAVRIDGAVGITLRGSGSRILVVRNGAGGALANLAVKDVRVAGCGAAVYVTEGGVFRADDVTFSGCRAVDDAGGAVAADDTGSAALFTRCTFENCSAAAGGAVYRATEDIAFRACTFSGNTADYGAEYGPDVYSPMKVMVLHPDGTRDWFADVTPALQSGLSSGDGFITLSDDITPREFTLPPGVTRLPDVPPTLQELIDATPAGGTCCVPEGTYGPASIPSGKAGITVVCTSGTAVVTSGYAGSGLTVSATNVTISGFAFRECSPGVKGDSEQTLFVTNCWFESCTNTYGGGVYQAGTVVDCVFTNCAAYYGGGVRSCREVLDCVFADCRDSSYGGGVYGCDRIAGCVFERCTAIMGGGAHSIGEMSRCTFRDCEAEDGGGACRIDAMFACLLVGNRAKYWGGGVCFCDNVRNCTFADNVSDTDPRCSGLYSGESQAEVRKPRDSVFCGCSYEIGNNYYTAITNLPAEYGTYTVDESVFFDAAGGDYHLKEYLAGGAERGATLKAAGALDLDGNPVVIEKAGEDFFAAGCYSSLPMTLQDRIDAASPGDTIDVGPGVYAPVTIPAGKTGLVLNGASKDAVTVLGDGSGRCLLVEADGVVISNMTFSGGRVPRTEGKRETGAGIWFAAEKGSATLADCTVTNCCAYDGGAVCAAGSLACVRCAFRCNTAEHSGGAVYFSGSDAEGVFTDCTFAGNTARVHGGAVRGGSRWIGCAFYGNRADGVSAATGEGGAIWFDGYNRAGCEGLVKDCVFVDNAGRVNGGAIRGQQTGPSTPYKTLDIQHSFFTNNTAAYLGGAVFGCTHVSGCEFAGNHGEACQGTALYNARDVATTLFAGNGSEGPAYTTVCGKDRDTALFFCTFAEDVRGLSGWDAAASRGLLVLKDPGAEADVFTNACFTAAEADDFVHAAGGNYRLKPKTATRQDALRFAGEPGGTYTDPDGRPITTTVDAESVTYAGCYAYATAAVPSNYKAASADGTAYYGSLGEMAAAIAAGELHPAALRITLPGDPASPAPEDLETVLAAVEPALAAAGIDWYTAKVADGAVTAELNVRATPTIEADCGFTVEDAGAGDTVSLMPGNIKPRLWYGLGHSETLAGPYVVEEGGWRQANEKGELAAPLTAPKTAAASSFYRVIVKE